MSHYSDGFKRVPEPVSLVDIRCDSHPKRDATGHRKFEPTSTLRMDFIFMCDECEAGWIEADMEP